MLVQDLIQGREQIYSVTEDTTTHDAARYLRHNRLRAVGVMDAQGKLVGALSQSDISDKVAAENKCPAWVKVSEVMTRELNIVTPDLSMDECLRRMERHRTFHLAVIDGAGKYQGMISAADLLEVIASDHKQRADLLEALLFPQR